MGVVCMVVVLCCLVISATITIIILLSSFPINDDNWISPQPMTDYFNQTPNKSEEGSLKASDQNYEHIDNPHVQNPKSNTPIPLWMRMDSNVNTSANPDSMRSSQILKPLQVVTERPRVTEAGGQAFPTTPTIQATTRREVISVTLRHHLEQLILKDSNKSANLVRLQILREMPLQANGAIVGMSFRDGLIYVATSDGFMHVIDAEFSEKVDQLSVNGKVHRMLVTESGDFIVLNGTKLCGYRNGKIFRQIVLPIAGKSLSTAKNKIYLLGRTNDVIIVFDSDLKPIDEIFFKNNLQKSCSIAVPNHDYLFVSCRNGILKISEEGAIIDIIGLNQAEYALGLTFDDQSRIIAATRGQRVLKRFQDGNLHSELLLTDQPLSIWSDVLYENGRLHIVDYLRGALITYRYPKQINR